MGTVHLKGIWLNLVADPTRLVALQTVPGFSRPITAPGQVRRGAGGRTRVFRRAGMTRTWNIQAVLVPARDAAWLEEHVGQLMCARDSRGHKLFGSYMSVTPTETNALGTASLSFEIQELTYSEAV